jgi:acyl dehydratase
MTGELSRPPRTLPLYARAVAAALPGARLLPCVPGNGGELPDVRLTLRGVRAEPDHLARYSTLCGFRPGEHLPATYPHILAFPLHMTILTDGRFPYPTVGLIHIENQIVAHRAIPRGERLELTARATGTEPHPRGVSFELISEALIAGERVWESTSTMLHRSEPHRGGQSDPPVDGAPSPPADFAGAGADPETWRLPRNLGRRYAAVSGDRNPIHMHSLPARALGFPGAIAHGMWTFARALAAVSGELADGHAIDGAFRKPIVLPASVQLSSRAANGETEFAVCDSERHTPHLRGRIWPVHRRAERTTPTGRQRA